MGVNNITKAILITFLLAPWTGSFAWGDASFETDRGNREPAVLGPAIIDDESTSALDSSLDESTDTSGEAVLVQL